MSKSSTPPTPPAICNSTKALADLLNMYAKKVINNRAENEKNVKIVRGNQVRFKAGTRYGTNWKKQHICMSKNYKSGLVRLLASVNDFTTDPFHVNDVKIETTINGKEVLMDELYDHLLRSGKLKDLCEYVEREMIKSC